MRKGGADGAVEDELQGMISKLLDTEREKIAEKEREAQGEAIHLLERKIKRLADSLDETEAERDKARRQVAAMSEGGGVALRNVMDVGLKDDDPEKEHKLLLLKDIFNENKELRDHLHKEGIEIKGPPREEAEPVAKTAAETGAAEPVADADSDEAAEAADDSGVAPSLAATAESDALEPADSPESDADDSALMTDDDADADEINPDDQPWEAPADEIDPDDMPWEPDSGDDTDADDEHMGPVKKMTGYKDFAPPPLQRKEQQRAASAEESAAETADENEPVASDEVNPDDMPWEPDSVTDESATSEVATDSGDVDPDDLPWEGPSDTSDDDEHMGPVKKISDFKNFEPPPLKRKDS